MHEEMIRFFMRFSMRRMLGMFFGRHEAYFVETREIRQTCTWVLQMHQCFARGNKSKRDNCPDKIA